jgi:septum formation protein
MARRAAIVLASASPRRRELVGLLGIEYEVCPPGSEAPLPAAHPRPARLAMRLARAKALEVAAVRPGRIIVGADTIVAVGLRLLGKPRDAAEARAMLGELSGRPHRVITGLAVVDARRSPIITLAAAETTRVVFRPLRPEEIDAYVSIGEPMDKAGAYAVQGRGAILVDGISGDYTNVVGLPVPRLAEMLRGLGVEILGWPVGNERGGVER